MAFLLCVDFSDKSGVRKHRYLRCSPLSRALALGWHQRLKVSVFIGFFSSLYTGSNVPFMFALVALYEMFSL